MSRTGTNWSRGRGLLGITVAALALLAGACVEPAPAPDTSTTTSTTSTTAPTTTSTTTTSTSTTTTTTTTTTSTTTTSTTTTSTTTTTTVPSGPTYTPISMSCSTSAAGQTSYDTLGTGVTTEAPATAAPGQAFDVVLTADPIDVPTSGGGYPIKNLTDVRVRFALPSGASFVGATLSGGSALGSGTPTVTLSGTTVVLTVPGPLAPGTTAVLPTVTATLQATGTSGTALPAQLAGTGYGDPSITFTALVHVLFFDVSAPSNCYAPTNPVLATTTIS